MESSSALPPPPPPPSLPCFFHNSNWTAGWTNLFCVDVFVGMVPGWKAFGAAP